jgi:hypothetical protein
VKNWFLQDLLSNGSTCTAYTARTGEAKQRAPLAPHLAALVAALKAALFKSGQGTGGDDAGFSTTLSTALDGMQRHRGEVNDGPLADRLKLLTAVGRCTLNSPDPPPPRMIG